MKGENLRNLPDWTFATNGYDLECVCVCVCVYVCVSVKFSRGSGAKHSDHPSNEWPSGEWPVSY